MEKKTKRTKNPQSTKAPVNKEAFKMLALEIGLNEACRRMNVPIPTGKSWARRGGWKLPKRPGGRPQRTYEASSLHPVADALAATHKELEDGTKTALMQTLHKAAQAVARKDPLDITNMAQFRDACLSAARMFGWDGCAQPSVTVNADKAVVVCDENKRRELQAQRLRLLAAEKPAEGRTVAVEEKARHEQKNEATGTVLPSAGFSAASR